VKTEKSHLSIFKHKIK